MGGGVSATRELKLDFSRILGTLDWPPVGGQKILGILVIKHKINHAIQIEFLAKRRLRRAVSLSSHDDENTP